MGQIVELAEDGRSDEAGQDDADPEIAEGGCELLDLMRGHTGGSVGMRGCWFVGMTYSCSLLTKNICAASKPVRQIWLERAPRFAPPDQAETKERRTE
jgi:hypothetical protein